VPRWFKTGENWNTQNPWFCLVTTLIAITVTYAFLLCNYHKVTNVGSYESNDRKKQFSIADFLANQLIQMLNVKQA
jgi:hypothetical protein